MLQCCDAERIEEVEDSHKGATEEICDIVSDYDLDIFQEFAIVTRSGTLNRRVLMDNSIVYGR
jgi:hypothetical protein